MTSATFQVKFIILKCSECHETSQLMSGKRSRPLIN